MRFQQNDFQAKHQSLTKERDGKDEFPRVIIARDGSFEHFTNEAHEILSSCKNRSEVEDHPCGKGNVTS